MRIQNKRLWSLTLQHVERRQVEFRMHLAGAERFKQVARAHLGEWAVVYHKDLVLGRLITIELIASLLTYPSLFDSIRSSVSWASFDWNTCSGADCVDVSITAKVSWIRFMSRCVCVRRAKHANMSRRTCVSEFQRYYVGIGGRGGGCWQGDWIAFLMRWRSTAGSLLFPLLTAPSLTTRTRIGIWHKAGELCGEYRNSPLQLKYRGSLAGCSLLLLSRIRYFIISYHIIYYMFYIMYYLFCIMY